MKKNKNRLFLAVLLLALGGASTARSEEQAGRAAERNAPTTADYAAFGRAYGMLRYYSPNPYTEGWDEHQWGYVAAMLAERFAAADSLPLAGRLQAVFAPLAPLAIFTTEPAPGVRRPGGQAYYRENRGVGERPAAKGIHVPEIFGTKFVRANSLPGTPQPDSIYSFRVGEHVWLNYPVAAEKAVFGKKEAEALQKAASEKWYGGTGKPSDKAVKLLGREEVRVADAITRWNIVRNFYPYYEEDNLEWEPYLDVMIDSVRRMELSGTKADLYRYHRLISGLMHPLRDGHVSIWPSISASKLVGGYIPWSGVPVVFRYVQGKPVLVDIAPNYTTRMQCYDVLETIDGIPVDTRVSREMAYVCAATDAARRERAVNSIFQKLIPGTDAKGFVVGYRNASGVLLYDTLRPVGKSEPYGMGDRETFVRELGGGIYYINAMSEHADGKHLKPYLPQLAQAKGIVVDVRGYPAWSFEEVLQHLTDREIPAGIFKVPVTCFPERIGLTWEGDPDTLAPKAPYLSVPKVFLTDGSAMSWGETVMMAAKGNGLGTVIGSPTAGTNGDVTTLVMPVFGFMMTGLHASNVDGSRHHGIGVLPDIEVYPTLEGLRAGRDEVLEAAVVELVGPLPGCNR